MKKSLIKAAKKTGIIFGFNEDFAKLEELKSLIIKQQSEIDSLRNDVANFFTFYKNTQDISSSPYRAGISKIIRDGNLKLLTDITNILQSIGVEYFLNYGTLLGAVRHGGFIPWDDDIDISVYREDFNKLLSELPKKVAGTRLHIVHSEIIRVYYADTPLQIDIFPFDFYPGTIDDSDRKNHDKKIKNIQDKNFIYDWSKLLKQEKTVISPNYQDIQKIIEKEYTKPASRADGHKNKYSIFHSFESPGYCEKILDYDWIYPLRPIKFMGKTFLGPNDPDLLLLHLYGDYMDYPSSITYAHDDIKSRTSDNTIKEIRNYLKGGK